MRYKTDANGYITEVFFGCYGNGCKEYTGTIPNGYKDLNEWSTNALINAYYINEEGNLTLDSDKLRELEDKIQVETIDNTPLYHKDLFGYTESINKQYTKRTATGKVITIDEVKNIPPMIKFTNVSCYEDNKLNVITQTKNMLRNDAKSEIINGITFTKLADGGIKIKGTSTATIEYTISGSSSNASPIFMLKKGLDYYLNLGGLECELKYFDGETTSQVYSGSSGLLNLSENKKVTEVILKIPTGTTVDKVIYPQLERGSKATGYVSYRARMLEIDLSEFVESALFLPTFLGNTTFLKGTVIDYVLIEDGVIYVSKNGYEHSLKTGNVNLFNGYNTIYTLQDTNIEIEYCINLLDVESLEFLQGKGTTTNKFKILDDGSIEAHNGYFSGEINATNGTFTDGQITIGSEKYSSNKPKPKIIMYSSENKDDNLKIYPNSLKIDDSTGAYVDLDIVDYSGLSTNGREGHLTLVSNDHSSAMLSTSWLQILSHDDNPRVQIHKYNTNNYATLCAGSSSEEPYVKVSNGTSFSSMSPNGVWSPSFNNNSLAKQKKNFKLLENALEIIKDTDIYKYNWQHEKDDKKQHIGFVIGKDYKYSKEITSIDDKDEEVGADIYSMVSVCFKAIQEQQKQIEELTKELNKLKESE